MEGGQHKEKHTSGGRRELNDNKSLLPLSSNK